MNNKLTLSLDKDIIEKAKIYASSMNISLSSVIQSYLEKLTMTEQNDEEIAPFINSLSGVIKLDSDYKNDYTDYLAEKYK
jgi:hypothetical protein